MSHPPSSVRDAPRDLAQAGSLSGAIFGALVGADPFDIRHRAHWVRYLDYAAIALWVVAVLLFLYAAAATSKAETRELRQTAGPIRRKLRAALLWATPLRRALIVAGGAGSLTVLALALTAFSFSVDRDQVQLELTTTALNALEDLCGTPLVVKGSLETQTLDTDFVVFDFQHPTPLGCSTVRIRKDGITALREHPDSRG